MLKEEIALFIGSGTCRYMYRHGHIQTEDLTEESLHFITAQSELTTLADKYPKTPRLAHFKIVLILFYLRSWCRFSTLCNYIKEISFFTVSSTFFPAIGKVCNGLEGLLYRLTWWLWRQLIGPNKPDCLKKVYFYKVQIVRSVVWLVFYSSPKNIILVRNKNISFIFITPMEKNRARSMSKMSNKKYNKNKLIK